MGRIFPAAIFCVLPAVGPATLLQRGLADGSDCARCSAAPRYYSAFLPGYGAASSMLRGPSTQRTFLILIHRGLVPAGIQALAQVNDYNESIRDPLNLKSVEKALGYIPEFFERAVLIGRSPKAQDMELWDKRRAEQPSVRIITYDQLLQEQRVRHAWRRRHHP